MQDYTSYTGVYLHLQQHWYFYLFLFLKNLSVQLY